MYRLIASLILCLAILLPQNSVYGAIDAGRSALVIGNNNYEHINALETAVNDARAMADTLSSLGIEVTLHENLDRRSMFDAIGRFADSIKGKAGIIYFAGHGVALEARNYLLPTDIKVRDEREVKVDAIALDWLLDEIANSGARLSVVFLDACRDNPLPKRATGRSIGGNQGLGHANTPNGTMVIYSAGLHEKALDRLGPNDHHPNGLFVRELLPELKRPGVPLYEAVRSARERIRAKARSVRHEQNPAIYDQLEGGPFYLVPPQATEAPLSSVSSPAPNVPTSPEPQQVVAIPSVSSSKTSITESSGVPSALAFDPSKPDWTSIQEALMVLDFGIKSVTGKEDLSTRIALRRWQYQNDFEATGLPNTEQYRELLQQAMSASPSAPNPPGSDERSETVEITSLQANLQSDQRPSSAIPLGETSAPTRNIITVTRACSAALDQHYARLWPESLGIPNSNGDSSVIGACDDAISMTPDNGSFYYWRGLVHLDNRRYQRAIDDFERAQDLRGPSASLIKKAQAQVGLGRSGEAIRTLNDALRLGASPIEAYYWRADLRLSQGNVDLALQDLRRVQTQPALGSTQSAIWLNGVMRLGDLLERRGTPTDLRQALGAYKAILARYRHRAEKDPVIRDASNRYNALIARL